MRISLRKLLLLMAVYAVFLTIVGGLRISSVVFAAGIVVITLFAAADIWNMSNDKRTIPICARLCYGASYYAASFAAAAAVSIALFMVLPAPAVPPRPAVPFLAGVLEIVSGQLFVEIKNAIATAMAIGITYAAMFLLSSILAFTTALGALRYYRAAKWLAIVNALSVVLYFYLTLLQP